MAREAKYTKTVAFRVTAEEAAAIEYVASTRNVKPSAIVRAWIVEGLRFASDEMAAEAKRAEAKAKRDAKKAAANDNA